MNNTLDIVVPCYNESKSILPLVEEVEKQCSGHFEKYNLILVNDGSKDNTTDMVYAAMQKFPNVSIQYLKFTRNYGKEIAVKCGIDHSTADYCAIMDGDLQHPPQYLIEASNKLKESATNIVYISPKKRLTYIHQKIGTYGYRKLLDSFSKDHVYLTDFSLFDKKTVNLIKKYNESDYYTRGILSLLGLKTEEIQYTPQERKYGKSTFSFIKLINLAISGVMSISTKPLRMAAFTGLTIILFSLIYGLYCFIARLLWGQPFSGFSIIGFGMFFLGGIQLLFLGVIGEYIGKIFIQVKQRPLYTIDMSITSENFKNKVNA